MNLENTGITENERSLRLRKAKGKEKPLHQISKAACHDAS
jgi:hypothetical protein